MHNSLFLISYYNSRPKNNLENLIEQLAKFNCQIGVIINDDTISDLSFKKINNIFFLKRHNIGMNIGAWDEGYRYFNDYENYFFFQDECFIKKNIFFEKYLSLLSNKNFGIIGESINWVRTWEEIKLSPINYSIKINGKNIDRVNFYKNQIEKWKIPLGNSPVHLRSLSLAMKKSILDKIDGFNIGFSKEQCIASEIAISKKVGGLNLKIIQSNEKHFYYIGHKEWDDSGLSIKIKD